MSISYCVKNTRYSEMSKSFVRSFVHSRLFAACACMVDSSLFLLYSHFRSHFLASTRAFQYQPSVAGTHMLRHKHREVKREQHEAVMSQQSVHVHSPFPFSSRNFSSFFFSFLQSLVIFIVLLYLN